ncbi:MAG: aminotransferase class IV [Gammaproteobacteria bacterium]|nr:aminotransferase class IV [Gammaproteobacteria bacterium]MDH3507677.1 aminotransferase class IV [Gammaproteobacteria bacterium]
MEGFQSMTNVDGVITLTEDARIPVMDRGFLYGDSVYEVFRTYGGVPLLYDEHWARFENSAALISLQLGLSKEQMADEIRQTVSLTNAAQSGRDVYVRFTMTRGEGPIDLFPGPDLQTRYVIIVKAMHDWKPEFYSEGVNLAITATKRNPKNALDPNIKGGNYLNNVLGVIEARAMGADDCLMLNAAGQITESSNSNVFFVMDGKLVSPAETSGNLRGLTKAAVREACRARGITTYEQEIAPAAVIEATECFVTSATREVMPVRKLNLGNGTTVEFPAGGGALTRQVQGYYRDYVDAYLASHEHLSFF